jgi:hypothetical protein
VSDELILSGTATTAVATEQLGSAATLLRKLTAEAGYLIMRVSAADSITSRSVLAWYEAPACAFEAETDMDVALAGLFQLQSMAQALEWALNSAADGYGFVEAMAGRVFRGIIGDVAGGVGMASLVNPALPVGVAGLAALGLRDPQVRGNPATVEAVRQTVSASDDALLGRLGVPRPVARAVGDEGLGLVGVSASAAGLAGAGAALGLVRDRPVRLVSASTTTATTPPTSFEDRVNRLPRPSAGDGSQVTIESYDAPGQATRYAVYIAGTVDFDPLVLDEPFDMESNVLNAAGSGSGSYEAVLEAMAAAGIDENSPVQLVGYSQGGGTAARIAESGLFDVQGILTFGGPTGNVDLPSGVPAVLVEHTDDIVPALGGAQCNADAVLVNRQVFETGHTPTGEPVPAHLLPTYRDTAVLMDSSSAPQLRDSMERFNRFGAGATVTMTSYEFERVGATFAP